MADENSGQQPKQEPRTFTQDEVNEMMGKVRRETREKFADYDALKQKADAYDEAQEAAKSELEKAQEAANSELEKAQEAAAKAEKELEAMRAEKARNDLAARVSAATGVPAALITGADEESMTASANAIAAYAKAASTAAPFDKGGAGASKPMSRDQILAIKDPRERRDAIRKALETDPDFFEY